ncbi:hypothetical protein, partial [Ruixingdingia sedimenti]
MRILPTFAFARSVANRKIIVVRLQYHGFAPKSSLLGRVDKRDSPGAVIVIQAGICNGDQR